VHVSSVEQGWLETLQNGHLKFLWIENDATKNKVFCDVCATTKNTVRQPSFHQPHMLKVASRLTFSATGDCVCVHVCACVCVWVGVGVGVHC